MQTPSIITPTAAALSAQVEKKPTSNLSSGTPVSAQNAQNSPQGAQASRRSRANGSSELVLYGSSSTSSAQTQGIPQSIVSAPTQTQVVFQTTKVTQPGNANDRAKNASGTQIANLGILSQFKRIQPQTANISLKDLLCLKHQFTELRFDDSSLRPDFSGKIDEDCEYIEEPFNCQDRNTDLALDRDPVILQESVSFKDTMTILEASAIKRFFPEQEVHIDGIPMIIERPALTKENYYKTGVFGEWRKLIEDSCQQIQPPTIHTPKPLLKGSQTVIPSQKTAPSTTISIQAPNADLQNKITIEASSSKIPKEHLIIPENSKVQLKVEEMKLPTKPQVIPNVQHPHSIEKAHNQSSIKSSVLEIGMNNSSLVGTKRPLQNASQQKITPKIQSIGSSATKNDVSHEFQPNNHEVEKVLEPELKRVKTGFEMSEYQSAEALNRLQTKSNISSIKEEKVLQQDHSQKVVSTVPSGEDKNHTQSSILIHSNPMNQHIVDKDVKAPSYTHLLRVPQTSQQQIQNQSASSSTVIAGLSSASLPENVRSTTSLHQYNKEELKSEVELKEDADLLLQKSTIDKISFTQKQSQVQVPTFDHNIQIGVDPTFKKPLDNNTQQQLQHNFELVSRMSQLSAANSRIITASAAEESKEQQAASSSNIQKAIMNEQGNNSMIQNSGIFQRAIQQQTAGTQNIIMASNQTQQQALKQEQATLSLAQVPNIPSTNNQQTTNPSSIVMQSQTQPNSHQYSLINKPICIYESGIGTASQAQYLTTQPNNVEQQQVIQSQEATATPTVIYQPQTAVIQAPPQSNQQQYYQIGTTQTGQSVYIPVSQTPIVQTVIQGAPENTYYAIQAPALQQSETIYQGQQQRFINEYGQIIDPETINASQILQIADQPIQTIAVAVTNSGQVEQPQIAVLYDPATQTYVPVQQQQTSQIPSQLNTEIQSRPQMINRMSYQQPQQKYRRPLQNEIQMRPNPYREQQEMQAQQQQQYIEIQKQNEVIIQPSTNGLQRDGKGIVIYQQVPQQQYRQQYNVENENVYAIIEPSQQQFEQLAADDTHSHFIAMQQAPSNQALSSGGYEAQRHQFQAPSPISQQPQHQNQFQNSNNSQQYQQQYHHQHQQNGNSSSGVCQVCNRSKATPHSYVRQVSGHQHNCQKSPYNTEIASHHKKQQQNMAHIMTPTMHQNQVSYLNPSQTQNQATPSRQMQCQGGHYHPVATPPTQIVYQPFQVIKGNVYQTQVTSAAGVNHPPHGMMTQTITAIDNKPTNVIAIEQHDANISNQDQHMIDAYKAHQEAQSNKGFQVIGQSTIGRGVSDTFFKQPNQIEAEIVYPTTTKGIVANYRDQQRSIQNNRAPNKPQFMLPKVQGNTGESIDIQLTRNLASVVPTSQMAQNESQSEKAKMLKLMEMPMEILKEHGLDQPSPPPLIGQPMIQTALPLAQSEGQMNLPRQYQQNPIDGQNKYHQGPSYKGVKPITVQEFMQTEEPNTAHQVQKFENLQNNGQKFNNQQQIDRYTAQVSSQQAANHNYYEKAQAEINIQDNDLDYQLKELQAGFTMDLLKQKERKIEKFKPSRISQNNIKQGSSANNKYFIGQPVQAQMQLVNQLPNTTTVYLQEQQPYQQQQQYQFTPAHHHQADYQVMYAAQDNNERPLNQYQQVMQGEYQQMPLYAMDIQQQSYAQYSGNQPQ